MAKVHIQSDIHGFLDALKKNVENINMNEDIQLIFLGDYIDYGPESGETLRYIQELQMRYGKERVIALMGNHEKMFLDWLDEYADINVHLAGLEKYANHEWLISDMECDFETFKTLVTAEQWERFRGLVKTASMDSLNCEAVSMIMRTNGELVQWLCELPYYYETESQIFVHAGVAEWAGEDWLCVTSDDLMVSKYPASKGRFYKDVIAGHISTARIGGEEYLGKVYWDGQSHYFVDGETARSGVIPVLVYDTETRRYEY